MQEAQEMRGQSLSREDPLEEEMVIHSSILAWEISRTEEPAGLQSLGSQRVRHDWVTERSTGALRVQGWTNQTLGALRELTAS